MLIRYPSDETLTGISISFFVTGTNDHHSVPATIEVIRDDAVYYEGDTPHTVARISAT
jgi:hypothetical protein